eukprot:s539_g7.t1
MQLGFLCDIWYWSYFLCTAHFLISTLLPLNFTVECDQIFQSLFLAVHFDFALLPLWGSDRNPDLDTAATYPLHWWGPGGLWWSLSCCPPGQVDTSTLDHNSSRYSLSGLFCGVASDHPAPLGLNLQQRGTIISFDTHLLLLAFCVALEYGCFPSLTFLVFAISNFFLTYTAGWFPISYLCTFVIHFCIGVQRIYKFFGSECKDFLVALQQQSLFLRHFNPFQYFLSLPVPILQRGPPGPKSGRTDLEIVPRRCLGIFILLGIVMIPSQCGGEGCLFQSWEEVRADFDAAALRGLGHSALPTTLSALPAVKKRSLIRAYSRAVQHGGAWYQGSFWTPSQFPAALQMRSKPQPQPAQKFHKPVRRFSPRARYNVLHVNVGGLSRPRLQEIAYWARSVEADLILLSETRWSFESEWQDDDFFYIHSGTADDKANGLLFMIGTHVCSADNIGFTAPMPGRLSGPSSNSFQEALL